MTHYASGRDMSGYIELVKLHIDMLPTLPGCEELTGYQKRNIAAELAYRDHMLQQGLQHVVNLRSIIDTYKPELIEEYLGPDDHPEIDFEYVDGNKTAEEVKSAFDALREQFAKDEEPLRGWRMRINNPPSTGWSWWQRLVAVSIAALAYIFYEGMMKS